MTETKTVTLAERSSLHAYRAGRQVLIVAEGKLPHPGFEVDVVEDPRRIFPPQFQLVRRSLPGTFPQVVTPYQYAESVPFPADQKSITVHHAEGFDEVDIQECGPDLAAYKAAVGDKDDEAIGFSKRLDFTEAFANAVANLPPSGIADGIDRVTVLEIGGLSGGFFPRRELFVRIRRVETT